ncbi:GNAT family N-acetyltransferase [Aquabacter spiritensis]|uniref:Acetyltransferase (GNAT) family protein n=1 Tax=Aquabacter spiritensis TaxID=933073 RepID=A0A4R3LZP7_9HYPH|nr:GNAT family N-acetyltransferase [Aquabacter spiritensis]TCT06241.1 acetyltransferase (GNAT) family protein [Aquabacter spiritensis]
MTDLPRLAGPEALGAVEAIIEAAYAPYVARIGRKPAPMLADYGALIAAGRVHVLDHAGAIRGVLVLIPEADALLLDTVAVAPAAQGLGLGRTLLDFAEQAARAQGYRAIRLYTNAAMVENIALYTRRHYVETHRAEEHGLKRVFMTKALGASPRRSARAAR